MPKLLFSKVRVYDIKELMPTVRRPRRIDIAFNRRRRKNDVQNITVQKLNDEMFPSNQSWQDEAKPPTLAKLLRDKKFLAAFRCFLQSEFSEENIDFWLAVEDFKKSSAAPGDLRWKAQKIYRDFIQPAARREINVDHQVREKIRKSLENPTSCCLDEAQKQVFLLMERDSCPRFLQSNTYRSLKRKSRTMWYV